MKKIIGSLLLLSVMATAFSQQPTTPVKDKQYYLDKSQSKKTTAWILLGAGTAAAVAGYIGFNDNFDLSGSSSADAYGFLFVGGVVADLASIPFFISAAHYKKLAADITIGNQNIYLLKQNSIAISKIPALIIKIHFR